MKEDSKRTGLEFNIQKAKIMASSPITSGGEIVETVTDFVLGGSKITTDGDCSPKIKRCLLAPWKKNYDKLRQHIKNQRHYIPNKDLYSQSYGFSSSHVWM